MSGLSGVRKHRCFNWDEQARGIAYAKFQRTATTCRLCDLCVKVCEAFADGCFPAFFQGARNDAHRAEILEDLGVKSPETSWVGTTMSVYFMTFKVDVAIYSPKVSDKNHLVLVEDQYFPFPYPFPWTSPEEEQELVARVPRPSTRHYSDGRSLERAEAWLRRCLDQHTGSCGQSDSYIPKRLLDLRKEPIRLFETSEINNFKEPYVCLSHRWGGPEHKRLTSTVVNIHNHMEGIAWDDIPKTFQDAIEVCRRMSASYLWIDTLCILQEYYGMSGEVKAKTETDFATENSAMARTYQNSQFTICASMSTSMDSGMFPRKYDHQIKVTGDDGNEAILRVTVVRSHYTPPTDLETRGWTYQEYLLPPRILDFGPFEVSWRCQKDQICECTDTEFPSNWGWRGVLAKQARQPERVKIHDWEKWWMTTVQYYTARNLTDHKDKLPALSGLAQIYHKATDHTYLAGLWRASLPHNLCWYHLSVSGIRARRPPMVTIGIGRRQISRAPSWSWASIDALHNAQCRVWWPGTVDVDVDDHIDFLFYASFEKIHVRQVCAVYEAAVKPKTDDLFGEVSPGGFLKLGVTLTSAKIVLEPQDDDPVFEMNKFKWPVAWRLDHFNEDGIHVFCLPDCGPKEDGLEHGDEVYCAPILERLSAARSERVCLVLKRLQNQEYRRVGFCILVKLSPNFDDGPVGWDRRDRMEKWDPNASENTSYALQWFPDTETRITIM